MRGLPGLVVMRSESNRGRGGVGHTFEVGTDMTRVMLDVVSRLNSLPPLRPDADEPQVFGGTTGRPRTPRRCSCGPPREVRVTFDPHRLAALGITPQCLAQAVIAARDVSAGFANVRYC